MTITFNSSSSTCTNPKKDTWFGGKQQYSQTRNEEMEDIMKIFVSYLLKPVLLS